MYIYAMKTTGLDIGVCKQIFITFFKFLMYAQAVGVINPYLSKKIIMVQCLSYAFLQ